MVTSRVRHSRSVVYGLLCIPVTVVIALYVVGINGSWWPLLFCIPLASFLASMLFWYLLIEKKKRYYYSQAIAAGILSGLFMHYLAWYLLLVSMYASYQLFGVPVSSLGEPPANPLQALWGSLGFVFFSVMWVGFATVGNAVVVALGYVLFLRHQEAKKM